MSLKGLKISIFSGNFGKPHTIFCTNPASASWDPAAKIRPPPAHRKLVGALPCEISYTFLTGSDHWRGFLCPPCIFDTSVPFDFLTTPLVIDQRLIRISVSKSRTSDALCSLLVSQNVLCRV